MIDPCIVERELTDRSTRPVFANEQGHYVFDDDGERAYSWGAPARRTQPFTVPQEVSLGLLESWVVSRGSFLVASWAGADQTEQNL